MPPPVPDLDLADVRYMVPPYGMRGGKALSNGSNRGTVAVLHLGQAGNSDTLHRHAAWITRERVLHGRSVAIELDRLDATAVEAALAAYPLGVRAVLTPSSGPSELWRQLSSPPRPWEDWVDLIDARQRVERRDLLGWLRAFMTAAASGDALTDGLDRLPVSGRTIRRQLQEEGLPKLEWWYHGARFVDAQLRLQADPTLSVGRVARNLGYADAQSFSNRSVRMFGATAETARICLGLEWRLRAWWDCSPR